jgi:hypothetical protein
MPGNPLNNPNWAPQIADTIERVVGQVRDKATTRVVVVVRALVFGIIIGVSALAAVVVGIILATRFIQVLVNIGGAVDADSAVWVSYLVMSFLLAIIGIVCMMKRGSGETAQAKR